MKDGKYIIDELKDALIKELEESLQAHKDVIADLEGRIEKLVDRNRTLQDTVNYFSR